MERECGFFDFEITKPGRASQALGAIASVYAIDIARILHEGPPGVRVKIKSEIVFNGSFERQKSAFSEQFFAEFDQFQTPGSEINHARIKHNRAVGGISRFFTQGSLRESSIGGRRRQPAAARPILSASAFGSPRRAIFSS